MLIMIMKLQAFYINETVLNCMTFIPFYPYIFFLFVARSFNTHLGRTIPNPPYNFNDNSGIYTYNTYSQASNGSNLLFEITRGYKR